MELEAEEVGSDTHEPSDEDDREKEKSWKRSEGGAKPEGRKTQSPEGTVVSSDSLGSPLLQREVLPEGVISPPEEAQVATSSQVARPENTKSTPLGTLDSYRRIPRRGEFSRRGGKKRNVKKSFRSQDTNRTHLRPGPPEQQVWAGRRHLVESALLEDHGRDHPGGKGTI